MSGKVMNPVVKDGHKDIIDPHGNIRRIYRYKTTCSVCGAEISSQEKSFRRHSGQCSSCVHRKRPYEYLYSELIRSNRANNHEINITYEDFLNIISARKCQYCEVPINYEEFSVFRSSRAYKVDRMDNSKGYIVGNCVPCCSECNHLKSNKFTYDEFMKLGPILRQIREEREK